jgi:hypothetical protein
MCLWCGIGQRQARGIEDRDFAAHRHQPPRGFECQQLAVRTLAQRTVEEHETRGVRQGTGTSQACAGRRVEQRRVDVGKTQVKKRRDGCSFWSMRRRYRVRRLP